MLEQKMISTTYPMLFRLMSEYGHSIRNFDVKSNNPKGRSDSIKFKISLKGHFVSMIIGSTSEMRSSISNKYNNCPVLNYLRETGYHIFDDSFYVKYCSAVVMEIEKYKKIELEAYEIIDKIDKFNVSLTRGVLVEKIS